MLVFIEGLLEKNEGIYYRELSLENPKGAVLIVHGSGEHIGRYEYVQKRLAKKGFASLGFDLRGHGKSSGTRSHIERFEEYLDDINNAYDYLYKKYKDCPKFLLGHSMGGLLALAFTEKHSDLFQGVFISSPFLGFKNPVQKPLKVLAKILSKVSPSVSFNNNIRADMVSRSQEVVKAYGEDSDIIRRVTARWFTEILRGLDETMRNAYKLKQPILILQAECDKLVDPEKSREFYKLCGSKDKEFEIMKNCYHELMNEPEKDEVIDRMIRFFESKI
jgi:lysophospholipase